MRTTFIKLASSIVVTTAVLASCTQDSPSPTEATVRLAVIAGGDHGGRPFSTSLTQELTTVPVWAGDPNGTGSALITVNLGRGEVCWQTSVSDIALPATAAHIHHAAAGIRGDIVVALSAPGASGTAVGCRSGIDSALLREILTSPESFYVNVHTTEFPAGAIRGQLP